ncbi:hypothetical protein ACF0H5_009905 [Mactra antiquata]
MLGKKCITILSCPPLTDTSGSDKALANNTRISMDDYVIYNPLNSSSIDNPMACSDLDKHGDWNFMYKYSSPQVSDALCRCYNICLTVVVPEHVRKDAHHYMYHPLSTRNIQEFAAVVTIYVCLFLFGVTGNIFVMVKILTLMRQSTLTFTFIVALCCSDLLVLTVCMPIKVVEHFRLGDGFNDVTCKLSYYLRDFSLTWSVLILTVISIERYFAICRPTEALYRCTAKRARYTIIGTLVLSLWLALPTPFVVKFYTPSSMFYSECLQQTEEEGYLILYFIFYKVVLFVVPCSIMSTMYYKIGRVLKNMNPDDIQLDETQRSNGTDENQASDSLHIRKRVLLVLTIIVAVFVISWGTPQLVNLLCGLNVIKFDRRQIRLAFETLTYFSCAINPVLFIAMSPKLCEQLCRYYRKLRDVESTNQQSETVASIEPPVVE